MNADEPLLRGELDVVGHSSGDGHELRIQLTLRRSEGEAARLRWNDQLAFPEYAWMSAVRVWDDDKTWLWPNLPYLLRAHGEERVERYGGVDPGKGVDNDFAAVLIRPLELQVGEGGQRELVLTPEPLVSAEWYPVDVENPGRRAIVHRARSDEFVVRLPSGESFEAQSGRLGVWLIYADFLDSRVPRSWPEEGEYDGGILAYLDVVWKRASDGGVEVAIHHMVPPEGTGFDWVSWSTGPSALEKNLELAQSNGCPQ